MKNKIKYTDEPLGKLNMLRDFLPPPEELAFKKAAQKHHTPYQKMIRRLIDACAAWVFGK